MRTAPANYTALLDNPNLNPVWIVIFDGLPAADGQFCSGDFGDIDGDWKKHIVNMRLRFGTIDLLEPHTDANEYEFEIADIELIFTNVLKDYDLLGGTVTIKIGFAELDEVDFVTLPSVTIERISLGADYLTWRIVAKDEFFRIKQNIFNGFATSTLDGDIAAFAATVSVGDTSNFVDPTTLPDWIRTGIVIDQEIKIYTAISGDDFTGCINQGDTAFGPHDSGAQVRQAIIFACDHLTALLHILTTTDAGGNGFYDLAIPGFGLSIPLASINFDNIEKVAYRTVAFRENGFSLNPLQASLVATEQEDLSWIEKNLLAPVGAFLFSNNGQIDVGVLDYIWYNENYVSIRDFVNEDIIDFEFGFVDSTNVIRTQAAIDPVTKLFRTSLTTQLDDGVSEYGENPKAFEYIFLGNLLMTVGFLARGYWWNRRVFDLYGDMAATVKFSALPRCWLVEPGDDIRITYDYLPDLIAGTRGWTNRKVRILGQEIDFAGECTFTGISWHVFNRVSGMVNGIYTINTVAAIDIDDPNVAFSANFAETPEVTEAVDGYYDNSGTDYEADLIVFFIELAEPGTGTGEQNVAIRISAIDASGGAGNLITADHKINVRYDAAGNDTRELAMYLYIYDSVGGDRFNDIDRIKVEFFDRSSAVANDQPIITFVGAWFVNHERDMSQV